MQNFIIYNFKLLIFADLIIDTYQISLYIMGCNDCQKIMLFLSLNFKIQILIFIGLNHELVFSHCQKLKTI